MSINLANEVEDLFARVTALEKVVTKIALPLLVAASPLAAVDRECPRSSVTTGNLPALSFQKFRVSIEAG